MNKKDFYFYNNILRYLYSYKNFEERTLNYNLDFFTRPYIHIDESCTSKLGNGITNKSDLINKVYVGNEYSHFGLVITCIVLASISILISCCMCIGKLASSKRKFGTFCIVMFIVVIFFAIILACSYYVYNKNKERSDLVSVMQKNQCSDAITNSLFDEIEKRSSENHKKYETNIILTSVCIGLFFVYIMYYYCCRKRYKKKKKSKKHKNKDFYDLNESGDHKKNIVSDTSSSTSSSDEEEKISHDDYEH